MVATIEQALSAGARAAADKAAGQVALFGLGGPSPVAIKAPTITLAKGEPWTEAETLASEKDALGFYVSSHPLDRWKSWAGIFTTANTGHIKEMQQDQRAVIAAMVQSVRTLVVKNGKSAGQKMAIITVEDMHGACDCALFTDAFAKFGHLAEAEKVVFVLGRVDLKRGEPQLIIDRLVPIEGVPLEGGRLRLMVDEVRLNGAAPAALRQVASLVTGTATTNGKPAPAGSPMLPVELVIGTETQVAVLATDPKVRVSLEPDLIKAVETELGAGMVRLVGGVALDKMEKSHRPWENKGRRSGGGD
jgi:DNA polymerase-3 subunit alpha